MKTSTVSRTTPPWVVLVRALALLCLETAALVTGVGFCLVASPATALLDTNAWSHSERNFLVVLLLAALVLVASAATLLARRFGVERVRSVAIVAFPLVPLSLLPALLDTNYWFHHRLPFVILLGAVALLVERSFRSAFAEVAGKLNCAAVSRVPGPWASRLPLLVVVLGATGYTISSGYLTVMKHHLFGTGAYDLAIFDNMMWNALHGHPFDSSVTFGLGKGSTLAVHAEIAQLLFVPFYAIHPSSEALLWIQAVCVGGAAIPLYYFARTQVGPWLSAILSLAYLLYAPIQGGQFYDFHWLMIATPFLFLLFYSLAVEKVWLTVGTTLLLWLIREDIAPGLVVTGLFLMLSNARPKAGAVLALSSAGWFALDRFVIMPSFGTWFFADLYSHLIIPGEKGYGSVIKTMLTNPVFVLRKLLTETRLEYFLHIVAPVALLPLRKIALWSLLLPGIFFTVLTEWPPAFSLGYQYTTHFAAYVFAATVLFLGATRSLSGRFGGAAAVVFCTVCHSAVFGFVLAPSSFVGSNTPLRLEMTQKEAAHYDDLMKVLRRIPADASVTATTRDSSHASARRHIFAFGHCQIDADYLVINPESFGLGSTREDIGAVLNKAPYGLVAKEGRITLWKKNYSSPETPAALEKLQRALGRGR